MLPVKQFKEQPLCRAYALQADGLDLCKDFCKKADNLHFIFVGDLYYLFFISEC